MRVGRGEGGTILRTAKDDFSYTPLINLLRTLHINKCLSISQKDTTGPFKGGINLNAIFPPLDMALMEISRSRFKQSKNSILIP